MNTLNRITPLVFINETHTQKTSKLNRLFAFCKPSNEISLSLVMI